MSRDLFTTTPEAAAQYERDHTPAYDERADQYEPDLPGRTTPTNEGGPLLDALAQSRRHWDAVFGPLRCAHGHCRTSLTDETAVYCGHGLAFCGNCTWEEACDQCATEAGAA